MIRYDPVYQYIVNRCTGRLDISQTYDPLIGVQWDAQWVGGRFIAISGELLREMNYDDPQIEFTPPLLKIGGYTLRFVQWWQEYDLAEFERVWWRVK